VVIQKSKKAYLYIAIAIILWATVASVFKIGLRFYTVPGLLFLSSLTSVITLFILSLVFFRNALLIGLRSSNLLISAANGLLNPFLYYLVLFEAYTLLPAQIAQPINFIWPVLLALLAHVFLKQKLNFISVMALLVSFSGVVIVLSQGNLRNIHSANYKGVLLCLLSSFLWALSWVINIKDSRPAVVKLFFSFLFATFYITLYCASTGNFPTLSIRTIGAPIYIGLFEMSITFYLWLRALELSGRAAKMANFIYLSPLLSFVFIHFIVKEDIKISSVLGLFIITGGLLLQVVVSKR
jgi:drug/metabolite transporter (DMT)-like permease